MIQQKGQARLAQCHDYMGTSIMPYNAIRLKERHDWQSFIEKRQQTNSKDNWVGAEILEFI